MNAKKKVTFADIAAYTGFSKTTISRYFNDPDSLTLENQQKIADALTALDFLGLGLPAEYPSLGDLVRQGKDNLQAPWIGISIFIVLSTLLSLLIFIGEGIRDAFDTRRNN